MPSTRLPKRWPRPMSRGHRPEFAALHHQPRRRFELPTYPFQRRRYWPKTSDMRTDGAPGIRNPR